MKQYTGGIVWLKEGTSQFQAHSQGGSSSIATELDPNTNFKVSNGWLDSFKRHNIKSMKVSGECVGISEETVTS